MGSSPSTPKPTAQELELQQLQRDTSNQLTRDKNEQLKSLVRQRSGQQRLLGGGSQLGILSGLGASGIRRQVPAGGGGGGSPNGTRGGPANTILSGGGGGTRSAIPRAPTPGTPSTY